MNDVPTQRAHHPLESLVDEALRSSEGEKVRIRELLSAYGRRSFGPVIAILALIVISPLGAIPFLPMIFALMIALISIQILFGRAQPWVPERIGEIGFKREKIEKVRERSAKWLRRIDNLIAPRLEWAAGETAQKLASIGVLLLSLLMAAPPLELIPYAAAVPASAVLLFGLGLTARDGVLMLLGFAVTATSFYLGYSWVFGGGSSG